MKRRKIYSTIAIASLMLCSSCYDLERVPDSKISSGSFFLNEGHAKMAMMSVYHQMQNDHVFGLKFSIDAIGGISCGYDPYGYMPQQKDEAGAGNEYSHKKWKELYEGVARTNNVIQNVPTCDMSDELKARYIAEARFMRGLYYFELLDYYGGVPIYDETTYVGLEFATMLKPRNTADEVREFVLDDFEAALALPKEWEQENYGRATWGAAMAMKGKTLLFAKRYEEAKECFQAIVDSHLYELYPEYADLFQRKAHMCSEMIFSIQNMGGLGSDIGMPLAKHLGTRSAFGWDWNNVMGSHSFVESYEWADGRPFKWSEFIPGKNIKDIMACRFNDDYTEVIKWSTYKQKLLEMYEQRDPRMMASVIMPFTTFNGWVNNEPVTVTYIVPLTSAGKNGAVPNTSTKFLACNGNHYAYPYRKFVPEGNDEGAINVREHTPINFPLVRYADVLLMLAECHNELGELPEAVARVNEVRARPSVHMPGLNSGPEWLSVTTKEEMFKRIRHERAVELCCEGHSYADMKRWGTLEELNGKKEYKLLNNTWYTRKVTARNYLWGIPPGELDMNPNLIQNPGY